MKHPDQSNTRGHTRIPVLLRAVALSGMLTLVVAPVNAGAGSGPEPDVATSVRFYGDDRYETAIAVSRATWADGEAGAVVLARGDNFPDALAGVPLAAHVDGPLLLTRPDVLRNDVRSELSRVLPNGSTIYVLGGSTSVAPAIVAELSASGYEVHRIAGSNRYETAVEIARMLPSTDHIMVATGENFPDALVASGPAAGGHGTGGTPYPVLLTVDGEMGDATLHYVQELVDEHGNIQAYAVGNQANDAILAAMQQHSDIRSGVMRWPLGGENRYETAAFVAYSFYGHYIGRPIGLVTGEKFPDALSASARLGTREGAILLTQSDSLPAATAAELGQRAYFGPVEIYGGTSTISAGVVGQATQIVTPSRLQDIALGDQVEVVLDEGESLALAFPATEGDSIIVEVAGEFDREVIGLLIGPGLATVGFHAYYSDGTPDSYSYHDLALSGEYRYVLMARESEAEFSIRIAPPPDFGD